MRNFITVNTQQKDKIVTKILLNNEYESFDLNLKDWSLADYINQWKDAAQYALECRCVSALITNYESPSSGVKKISIFTIIPEELTDPKYYAFQDKEAENFYLTESFVFITNNIEVFLSNNAYDDIKKVYGDYFPIIYFDEKNLFRFYMYLSDKVNGISNWKIEKSKLKTILNLF